MSSRGGAVAAGYVLGALAGGVAWYLVRNCVVPVLLRGARRWFPLKDAAVGASAGDLELGSQASRLEDELQSLRAEARRLEAETAAVGRVKESFPAEAPEGLWKRDGFLAAAAAQVQGVAQHVLPALSGTFDGSAERLAAALRAFFDAAAGSALEEAQACRQGLLAAAGTSVPAATDAAERAAAVPALTAHAQLVLAYLFTDKAHWTEAAERCVTAWLDGLHGGRDATAAAALDAPQVRAALVELAAGHMRLTLWPEVVDAGMRWAVDADVLTAALDNDSHQLFSLDGSLPDAGARVLLVGPSLLPRQPVSADAAAAPASLLAELRRQRRTLVVPA